MSQFSHELISNFTLLWILFGLIIFVILLFIRAPYGKHYNIKWGPEINNKLGWIVMEMPALLICPITYLSIVDDIFRFESFFILLWVLHYFNRTIIYPLKIKTKNKKMPLLIAASAIFFNLINGLINGYFLSLLNIHDYNLIIFTSGFFIFLLGGFINIQSDDILINLRRENQKYFIPTGGLFNYVSSPNYFGEIMEWFGFFIMTLNLGTFSFFIWTFVNLVPRSISNHKWYIETFNDYPKERKILIPKIF